MERTIKHSPEFDVESKLLFDSTEAADDGLAPALWKIARESDFNLPCYFRFPANDVGATMVLATSIEFRERRIVVYFTVAADDQSATLLGVIVDSIQRAEDQD